MGVRRCLTFLAPAILAAFAASPVLADTVIARVAVLPCAVDQKSPPELTASQATNLGLSVPISPKWHFANAVWIADIALPAGPYTFNAGSPHCSSAGRRWVAIAGGLRHLALALNMPKVVAVDRERGLGTIYGHLPWPSGSVEILSMNDLLGEQSRRPAEVDGDTYQVSDLQPGLYVLRLASAGIVESQEIVVPQNPLGSFLRVDFSVETSAYLSQWQARGSTFVEDPASQTSTLRLAGASTGYSLDIDAPGRLPAPADYQPTKLRLGRGLTTIIASVQRFLHDDARSPAGFRDIAAWTLWVEEERTGAVRVVLRPIDVSKWAVAQVGAARCDSRNEPGALSMTIDPASGQIYGVDLCP